MLISKTGQYEWHAQGHFVPRVGNYSVAFTSVYGDSRFPSEHRNLLQLNLSASELDTLIGELQKIRGINTQTTKAKTYAELQAIPAGIY